MPVPFRTMRRVEFGDTDMAGIMHFARFFHFMEQAECEFLRSCGLSVVMPHGGRKIGWPRVAAKCDFFKPVFFEDVVDMHVTLQRLGNKSLTYITEFFKAGDLVARGEMTSVCCLMEGDRPQAIPLPEDVKKLLVAASNQR